MIDDVLSHVASRGEAKYLYLARNPQQAILVPREFWSQLPPAGVRVQLEVERGSSSRLTLLSIGQGKAASHQASSASEKGSTGTPDLQGRSSALGGDASITGPDWYRQLVADCRVIRSKESLGFLTVLKAKHAIGERVRQDAKRLKVGRPRKNSDGVSLSQLAKDIGYGLGEINNCVRFAGKYPDFDAFVTEKFSAAGENFLGWHTVRQTLWGDQTKALEDHRQLPVRVEIPGDADREPLLTEVTPTNVWPLNPTRIRGYGSPDFRGNTSPEILARCLARYTNPGDLVLDPMVGSGTTIDVCKAMGRRVIASDIKAWREDFNQVTDAEKIETNEPVDFIFAHIPYLGMYRYTGLPSDLSSLNLKAFVDKLDRIFARFRDLLKPKRFLAVLVGDVRKSGLVDLSGIVSQVGSRHLKLWDKAVILIANPASHASAFHGNISLLMDRARRFNFMVQAFDTLLVFRKNEKEE